MTPLLTLGFHRAPGSGHPFHGGLHGGEEMDIVADAIEELTKAGLSTEQIRGSALAGVLALATAGQLEAL